MTRRSTFIVCFVVCASMTASFVVSAFATQPMRTSAHSALQATGKEWSIRLSRTKVKPGTVRVEFVNLGEDDHDLAVTRKGGSTVRFSEIRPKEREVKTIKVRKGSYVFWCTLDGHKSRGMRSVLKVRR